MRMSRYWLNAGDRLRDPKAWHATLLWLSSLAIWLCCYLAVWLLTWLSGCATVRLSGYRRASKLRLLLRRFFFQIKLRPSVLSFWIDFPQIDLFGVIFLKIFIPKIKIKTRVLISIPYDIWLSGYLAACQWVFGCGEHRIQMRGTV